jgi:hypothetical protein
LFDCCDKGEYIRIRTPYLYPDGDVIDLYCRDEGDMLEVTDLGETSRWLRMQTFSLRRSAKQRALIYDICLNHGVEWFRGMLQVRVHSAAELGEAIIRVAQAAIQVADVWFTFRTWHAF